MSHGCTNKEVSKCFRSPLPSKILEKSGPWTTRHQTAWSIRITAESINMQSAFLASGAVWLTLGQPQQPNGPRPEGCHGRPRYRCSQTALATRIDCVYHHGTETPLKQVKLENRTRRDTFLTRKKKRQKPSAMHARLQISAPGWRFAISHGSN